MVFFGFGSLVDFLFFLQAQKTVSMSIARRRQVAPADSSPIDKGDRIGVLGLVVVIGL